MNSNTNNPPGHDSHVPLHVGIIMDGNGRWAQTKGIPRSEGHKAGTLNVRPIAEACANYGVRYLTIYALSTENWARPRSEIETLLGLIGDRLRAERKSIFENRIQIRILGSMSPINPALRLSIRRLERSTKHFDRLTLNIAFNYGGRAEIVRAVQNIIREGVDSEDVSEDLMDTYMYTNNQPDPDLIIRTGGEQRISNFLLWQSAYAEFFISEALWPDFDIASLHEAFTAYGQRDRRYGQSTLLSHGDIRASDE
tara:strand:- start:163 stop:924 length:762 start_codon:yes stop_codon:yes gene_type:complete